MKTANIAHVCTCGRVPILGEIWEDETAELAALNAARSESPPANWAGQHPVLLPPTPRTSDTLARHCYDADLSPCHHLMGGDRLQHTARRRGHDMPDGIWDCSEYRSDALGRVWRRHYAAVTDDFGWLVEVPTC